MRGAHNKILESPRGLEALRAGRRGGFGRCTSKTAATWALKDKALESRGAKACKSSVGARFASCPIRLSAVPSTGSSCPLCALRVVITGPTRRKGLISSSSTHLLHHSTSQHSALRPSSGLNCTAEYSFCQSVLIANIVCIHTLAHISFADAKPPPPKLPAQSLPTNWSLRHNRLHDKRTRQSLRMPLITKSTALS